MTDRPYPGGSTQSLAADTAGPTPGYYPDPSIPGFVRYWGGSAWVPGTSRPAPAPGEVLEPPRFVARYVAQAPQVATARYVPPPVVPEPGETGPVYFDETSAGTSFAMASDGREVPDVPQAPQTPHAELELRARGDVASRGRAGTGAGAGAAEGVAVGPEPELEALPMPQPGAMLRPVTPESWARADALGGFGGFGGFAGFAEGAVPQPGMAGEPWGDPGWGPAEGALAGTDRPSEPAAEPVAGPVAGDAGRPVVDAGPRPVRELLPSRPPVSEPEPELLRVEVEVAAEVSELPVQPSPEPGWPAEDFGWRADPLAQRGLLETGNAPRWVTWGVDQAESGSEETEPGTAPAAAAGGVLDGGPVSAAPWDGAVAGGVPRAAGGPEAEAAAEATAGGSWEAESARGRVAEPRIGEGGVAERADSGGQTVGRQRSVPETARSAGGAGAAAKGAGVGGAVPGAGVSGAPRPGAGGGAGTGAGSGAGAGVGASAGGARSAGAAVPRARAGAATPKATPAAGRPQQRRTGGPAAAAGRRGGVAAPVVAGLGRRLVARAVDTAVFAVVAVAAGVPLLGSALAHVQEKVERAQEAARLAGRHTQVWLVDSVTLGKFGALLGVLVLLGVVYEILPTSRTGQTFGKRLARIKVVDAAGSRPPRVGRSVARWLVRQVGVLLVLGLLSPLLDRRTRRAWHDRAARTRVVRA